MSAPLWWTDPTSLSRIQAATGALGVLLAVVAVLYAWRVARRQFEVMDEQTAISKRQMALAEKQDALLDAERSRRAILTLTLAGIGTRYSNGRLGPLLTGEAPEQSTYQEEVSLSLRNSGFKSAADIYFQIAISGLDGCTQSFVLSNGLLMIAESVDDPFNSDNGAFIEGRIPGPVYPDQRASCVTATLQATGTVADRLSGKRQPARMARYSLQWGDERAEGTIELRLLASDEPHRTPDRLLH